MIKADTIKEMKEIIRKEKKNGKKIGLVPTMGSLHEGHLSLIRRASEENDQVAVSIFVNPTQFNDDDDFASYPRTMERDIRLAEEAGAGIVFCPTSKEMYPQGYKTYVNVETITEKLCGAFREGHFRGVTTIVCKLFNIVQPDKAYFGQKDAQQLIVVRKMVEDLNMDVEVVACPTVREKDGLALSSRNVHLSFEERKKALQISRALFEAEEMIKSGIKDADKIKKHIIEKLGKELSSGIEYVEIVDGVTIERLKKIEGNVLIAIAAKVGKTRLIDNIQIQI